MNFKTINCVVIKRPLSFPSRNSRLKTHLLPLSQSFAAILLFLCLLHVDEERSTLHARRPRPIFHTDAIAVHLLIVNQDTTIFLMFGQRFSFCFILHEGVWFSTKWGCFAHLQPFCLSARAWLGNGEFYDWYSSNAYLWIILVNFGIIVLR